MNYSGIARNDSEHEQALLLAESSFSPSPGSKDTSTMRKAFLLREHPGYTNESPIVVCSKDSGVVASAFLIKCSIHLHHRFLPGVFISSVSVAEKFRGEGVSRLLMRAAIDAASARRFDIAIVIARRLVDGFYTRFGFWGLAQYSKITLKPATLPMDAQSPRSVCLKPLDVDSFGACAALYASNYAHLAGHCFRSPEMWTYILGKLPYLGLKLDLVMVGDIVAGYAVHDGAGNFHEIATNIVAPICSSRSFLSAFPSEKGELTLHIPPTHPFVTKLNGGDVSLTLRECSYGGHMVRVLNPDFPVCALSGLGNGIDAKNPPLSFVETARILGVARVTEFEETNATEMRGSFNIPILDQI